MLRAIRTTGLGDMEKHVVKATYKDEKVPKEKHVRALVQTTRSMPHFDFAQHLEKRLGNTAWNVVLKTLIVIHRISREGHSNFLNNMARYSHILNFSSFADHSSTLAWEQSHFIQAYSRYLAEKVYLFKVTNFSFESVSYRTGRDWLMEQDITKILLLLPKLQGQFDKALVIEPSTSEHNTFGWRVHPIQFQALHFLLKDSFNIYSMITVCILRLLEKHEQLKKRQAKQALEAVTHFAHAQNDKFRTWAHRLTELKLGKKDLLPDFDALDANCRACMRVLSDYIYDRKTPRNIKLKPMRFGGQEGIEVKDAREILGKDVKLVVERTSPESDSDSSSEEEEVEKKKKRKKKKSQGEGDWVAKFEISPPTSQSQAKPEASGWADFEEPEKPKERAGTGEFDVDFAAAFGEDVESPEKKKKRKKKKKKKRKEKEAPQPAQPQVVEQAVTKKEDFDLFDVMTGGEQVVEAEPTPAPTKASRKGPDLDSILNMYGPPAAAAPMMQPVQPMNPYGQPYSAGVAVQPPPQYGYALPITHPQQRPQPWGYAPPQPAVYGATPYPHQRPPAAGPQPTVYGGTPYQGGQLPMQPAVPKPTAAPRGSNPFEDLM